IRPLQVVRAQPEDRHPLTTGGRQDPEHLVLELLDRLRCLYGTHASLRSRSTGAFLIIRSIPPRSSVVRISSLSLMPLTCSASLARSERFRFVGLSPVELEP